MSAPLNSKEVTSDTAIDAASVKTGSPDLMLPFMPTADHALHYDVITVWWFEADFCQSMYGPHSSCNRNACTLIALLTAAKILADANRPTTAATSADAITGAGIDEASSSASRKPPYRMVQLFAESMLLGNHIYCEMEESKRLPHLYLNIPEAMEATAQWIDNVEEWQSFVFMDELLSATFYEHLNSTLQQWWSYENQIERPNQTTNKPNDKSVRRAHICVVLIAECRSILLAIEQRPPRISVYDSHQHSATTGSCIASTPLDQLPAMCKWIQSLFADIYEVRPTCFELSYIQTRE